MRLILALATVACLLVCNLEAGKNKRSSRSNNAFDYYLLVLSYGPDFCDEPGGNKDPRECGAGRKVGFVVHGLWPQGEGGRGPENCGGHPVSGSIVQTMLNYIPSAGLIQHEWTTHGTCSGLDANAYFAQVRKAKDAVTTPRDLAQPSSDLTTTPSQVESKFSAANPGYAPGAFRTSCYNDGELQEVRLCLTKDLTPRACPASLPECRATSVTLKHVR